MKKIYKLLDLFCGAGGAAMGYYNAGFNITGVDIKPQKHFPFEFIQADAMDFLKEHGREYDVIHASPPCQEYSRLKGFVKNKYSDLIGEVRDRLKESGKYYIIENVPCAPLVNYLLLCGTMFGLNVIRHRLFECNPTIYFPPHPCNHNKKFGRLGYLPRKNEYHCIVGHFSGIKSARVAMGINWMNQKELSQAIPPAYTEYIGRKLLELL